MAKSDSKSVYALIGDEPYLQLQELDNLLAGLPKDVDRVNVDGETAQIGDVFDHLRTFAMFGGGKLVVVRDAEEFISTFREPMENYVAKPSESCVLVLRCKTLPAGQRIYKAIDKLGGIIKCEPPKQAALPGWIIRRAKEAHDLTIPIDAAQHLADLIGIDLGRIDSELAKLALMSTDGKVTGAIIMGAVAFQKEQEMWRLTDTLSTGNIAEAVRRWRQLLQMDPSSEFRAVTWLTIWLEKLTRVRLMSARKIPPFTIAKELRIWPATQIDSMLKMIQRLGERGIRAALDRLVKADHRSKSGLGEASTNVEAFLLSLA